MSDRIISGGFAALSLGMILIAAGSIFRTEWMFAVGVGLMAVPLVLSIAITFVVGIMGVFGKGPLS